ncbi:thiamine diphosphokinase [Carnobacterium divergens]|uniref:thiamine diphosphokinase n=1 Tax=Carnobacterium divergens TaxID=2748 RepID=UPI001071B2D4|nr:thiamine diphosphokinase [Carnobacterium divergens]MDT1996410.1 thiamine diphosphokinase [Carnobacterium divergens]TFI62758.1 thiamine diphosphokinase [Carnobacterium divergens]TFI63109.1 thiamine diphosphokinase [Carnobacterium divergens]TFI67194.1 thiamine diphosphokinase [Carnobacterium divergens]TFI78103.1 thiamine diphosphokinase [Carnobacterium divergens]
MSSKVIAILLGGPLESVPDLMEWSKKVDGWIGVDRGSLRLVKAGINQLIALGDFDSITATDYELIQEHVKDVRRCQSEKDETDAELALSVALDELEATKVILLGATGGRLDHFLSNLWMVLQPRFKKNAAKIQLVDQNNSIRYYLPGHYQLTKEPDKKYLGFTCLTPVTKLSLFDEKYQLDQADFAYPTSLGSNEFLKETGEFSFESGIIAVIQSKD